jgi:DegV family protein with EDD domain
MTKIAIVTDSTAYIPPESINGYPIFVVPLQVIWGDDTYRDGLDIQPDEFYQRLKTAAVMPTTSQPSPAAFLEIYSRLLNEGYEILSVHISSKLSGTVDSAIQAKAMLPDSKIEIIDSESTSMGLGFFVLGAARLIRQGATLQECKQMIEEKRSRSEIYFVVDTLEFLHRGGRIGGAAAFLGTVLNLKPILQLVKGRIEAVEKVRTSQKALNRLIDLVEANLDGRKLQEVAVINANASERSQLLSDMISKRFGFKDISTSMVSPVIGTHTGPGTVGICFVKE